MKTGRLSFGNLVVICCICGNVEAQMIGTNTPPFRFARDHWIGHEPTRVRQLEKYAEGFGLCLLSVEALQLASHTVNTTTYFRVKVVNPDAIVKGGPTHFIYAMAVYPTGDVDYMETDKAVMDHLNKHRPLTTLGFENLIETVVEFAQLRGYETLLPYPKGLTIPKVLIDDSQLKAHEWNTEVLQMHDGVTVQTTLRTDAVLWSYYRYQFVFLNNGEITIKRLSKVWQMISGYI